MSREIKKIRINTEKLELTAKKQFYKNFSFQHIDFLVPQDLDWSVPFEKEEDAAKTAITSIDSLIKKKFLLEPLS